MLQAIVFLRPDILATALQVAHHCAICFKSRPFALTIVILDSRRVVKHFLLLSAKSAKVPT
jgi:hypothetical protein